MNGLIGTRLDMGYRQNPSIPHKNKGLEEDLCAAARNYARSIASDDATYVRAYLAALNNGAALRQSATGKWGDMIFYEDPVPSSSLIGDPLYTTNARRLYASPRTLIIPQDDNLNPAFESCVAIRQGDRYSTGVLVARNIVVTIAHSTSDRRELRVLAGSNALAPAGEVRVRDVIPHPAFDSATHANDITVLILENDIDDFRHARMAESSIIDSATDLRIVAFGHADTGASVRTGIKRAVDVPIASPRCEETQSRDGLRCHPETELVVGKPALGRDSCAVDGGAPCYIRSGNQWHLAGIISRPISGYHYPCGDGSVTVRIDHHMPWIQSIPGGRW